MVLAEFPGLAGSTTEDLEALTQDLLRTMTVLKVSAAYIGGEKVDLFGREARSEAKERAKKRNRETNEELGIVENNEPPPKTIEELRKFKEFDMEIEQTERAYQDKKEK